MTTNRILILGFGNPGRRDDGLGPALAAALERRKLAGVTIDADYQLTVEDAAVVADHDVVLFVDAAATGPDPFAFTPLAPAESALSFSTHSVRPAEVLVLATQLFAARPEAYLLGIRGYEFNEFGEGLSPRARGNLDAALAFVVPWLERRTSTAGAATPVAAPTGDNA